MTLSLTSPPASQFAKVGKKLFRKKVVTSYELKGKPAKLLSAKSFASTYKAPTYHPQQLQPHYHHLQHRTAANSPTPLNWWVKNSSLLQNLLRRLPLKRRSDSGLIPESEQTNFRSPQRSWWWARYLSHEPLETPSNYLTEPDYTQNPLSMLQQPQISNPQIDTGLLKSLLGILQENPTYSPQPQTRPFELPTPEVPQAYPTVSQPVISSTSSLTQQQQPSRPAHPLLQMYGRKRLYRPRSPTVSRTYLSKLTSPYSYYAYQSLRDNYFNQPTVSVIGNTNTTTTTAEQG